MKILYCYEYDFRDEHRQSGRPWQLRRALIDRGYEVVDLPDVLDMSLDWALVAQVAWRFAGRMERRDRDPTRLKRAAAKVEHAFVAQGCDIVVAPSSIPIAYLPATRKTFLVLDAFFSYNVDRYDSFSRLTPKYLRDGMACDDAAMTKCSGIVVPTQPLADAMAATGLITAERLRVSPWGPNLTPRETTVSAAALSDRFKARRILFVGREWRRKGLDMVFDAMRTHEGADLSCTVLGLRERDVPKSLLAGLGPRVQFLGELSLASPAERAAARTAFDSASLLMVPTRAENFGITFVEALAFGLPIVTSDSDGLASTLGALDCATLLPGGSAAEAFARAATYILSDADRYEGFSREAERASQHFSWSRVVDALEQLFVVHGLRPAHVAGAEGE